MTTQDRETTHIQRLLKMIILQKFGLYPMELESSVTIRFTNGISI